MNSFEINKLITAVFLVVFVVFGIGKISDIIFAVKKPDVEGYKVEVKVADGSASQVSSETQIDIVALLSMGDVEHGKKIFKRCLSCHSVTQDGGNKIGPKLWNVMFRPVGAISDYKYSKSLLNYKKEWTWEEMNGFLIKPSKWIPNNKMGFAGLKSDKDRSSVILYLNQNSDNPKTLP